MEKEKLDILIDKSVLGTLTQDERSKLEAYIMKQPTTKLEIKMREDIMKALEYNADQDMKSLLNKIHKEEILGVSSNRIIRRIGLALLSISIILAAYFLFKYLDNGQNTQQVIGSPLYATYFEPYSPSLETRNNVNDTDETYLSFVEAYRVKDYDKSLTIIKPLLPNVDNRTLLLAGISAMQTGKSVEAIEYLDQIIASNDFYFIDHAKWYKALELIKTNKINESKILLNALANNPKADHHDESVLLLKEL